MYSSSSSLSVRFDATVSLSFIGITRVDLQALGGGAWRMAAALPLHGHYAWCVSGRPRNQIQRNARVAIVKDD